jgi:hypothetical protein
MLNVLIGCEFTGTVREAFRKWHFVGRGGASGQCNAWSCDLLPAADGSPYHYKENVFKALNRQRWDVIILHPPCTALAVSGNRWYGEGQPKHSERLRAVEWTAELWERACDVCEHVALENPVGVLPRMAGMKPSQYVNPWQFGHPEQKKTGLWLHGLPRLEETRNVRAEMDRMPKRYRQRLHYLPPSADRWAIRSKTFDGIAGAMAAQWGLFVARKYKGRVAK